MIQRMRVVTGAHMEAFERAFADAVDGLRRDYQVRKVSPHFPPITQLNATEGPFICYLVYFIGEGQT